MFRGRADIKLDEKGRLKLPARFRQIFTEHFGPEVFLTSLRDEEIALFPLETWRAQELILLGATGFPSPDIEDYLLRANSLGELSSLDSNGRLVLPAHLRRHAGIESVATIVGLPTGHLEIWSPAYTEKKSAPIPPAVRRAVYARRDQAHRLRRDKK